MSTPLDRVLLFPGQGAFRDGELPRLARHSHVRRVFDEIDRVADEFGVDGPGRHVLASGSPSLEQLVNEAPDVLQLALFGTSIALWNALGEVGRQTGVLAGHSSGEIAALVAGGAFTVAEGAEIIVHRNAVLAALPRPAGGMLALACDAERARHVLEAVGDPLAVVAVRNGPRQVVLSGPATTLDAVAAVADALRISTTALTVAHPFHSPVLAAAVPQFAARIRHVEPRPLRTLVFSPILGRFHRATDALGEHIAASLVAPVDFEGALRRLHDAGARTFVECATAGTLTRLVQQSLPDASAMPASVAAGLDAEPVRPAPEERLQLVPSPPAPAVGDGRDALFSELVAIYADALEYPTEVFTENVALEEDLGIDSVKQTELMARVAERYGLPQPPPDFRLADYDTMGKLVDYVQTTRGTAPAPVVALAPSPVPAVAGDGRDALFSELVAIYADALEYPTEVFTENVALEEDLGIDSVKQTELMARVAERYGLPQPPPDFRLADYDTMGKLVDYVQTTRELGSALRVAS